MRPSGLRAREPGCRALQGEGFWSATGRGVDSRVHVSVHSGGQLVFKTKSKRAARTSSPEWRLVCAIDLAQKDPLAADIGIEVRRAHVLSVRSQKRVCAYYASLRDLLRQAPADSDVRRSLCLPLAAA